MDKQNDTLTVLAVAERVHFTLPHPSAYFQSVEKDLNAEVDLKAKHILDEYHTKCTECKVRCEKNMRDQRIQPINS